MKGLFSDSLLLRAQPAEVWLIFEALSDALIAHDDQDHLHRLAPERRAPVLKLLERLNPGAKKKKGLRILV